MRMDERSQHPTPGEDRVRDGRHLLHQEDIDFWGTEVGTKELMPDGWRLIAAHEAKLAQHERAIYAGMCTRAAAIEGAQILGVAVGYTDQPFTKDSAEQRIGEQVC